MPTHYLDQIVQSQKRGEARGIPSICSAHPYVIKEALKVANAARALPLVEATCNQVNQLGGYTGMTPLKFVEFVRVLAEENKVPHGNIILGGDHLGPSAWRDEPAASAMQKSEAMVRSYVEAGFVKIHLDCSMKLADDPPGALDVELSALRAAQLAKVAEASRVEGYPLPRYIIGTEVPVPGGAHQHEEGIRVTDVKDARQTIEVTREAFQREGLQSAWERVIAAVVQPGVEFGDDFVLPYRPEAARELSQFIESQSMVYEAHSTDYQTRSALQDLVRGHFAILKVGPALTFAFREAVFALARIEDELFPREARSNLIEVMDQIMTSRPQHWQKYYHGTPDEQAFKRKFSLSDRIRYYWADPRAKRALEKMIGNLNARSLPPALISRFLPQQYEKVVGQRIDPRPEVLILDRIAAVLEDYFQMSV